MSEYFTSYNAPVFVTLDGLSDLQKRLIAAGNASGVLGGMVIANTAAAGRRAAKDIEHGEGHRMGGTYMKMKGSHMRAGGTVFDSKLGGWKSKRTGLRTMGFSFESYEARRSKTKFRRAVSQISMYSLIANLFEEGHTWSRRSPGFQYPGGRMISLPKGYRRDPRSFFLGNVKAKVVSSMAMAIKKAEDRFEGILAEEVTRV